MKRTWKRALKMAALVALAVVVALGIIVGTGLDERWARGWVMRQLERATGARVELGAFHFHLLGLRAELDDLTLHGSERPGLPPLFHAERIRASAHILSFFSRKISLNELTVERPSVAVRIDRQGKSNVPAPKVQGASRPWRERLFDLRIRQLELDDGSVLYNDVRAPLTVQGQDFHFRLDFDSPLLGKEFYVGVLGWKQVEVAARRYLPFRSDVDLKFTLTRDSFSLDDFRWKLPNSEIDARAELASFAKPDWTFHTRGRLSLQDVRTILRKPHAPGGQVDFSGDGNYAAGQVGMSGHYKASEISMPYDWFHAKDIECWGRFEVAKKRLTLPKFEARALGGSLEGHLDMDFHGFVFRVESRMRGASLAAVLAAVDNRSLPVHTLHWDGVVDVDAVNTWTEDFKHFSSRGESRLSPPTVAHPGVIPAVGRLDFYYSMDRRIVELTQSEISTPTSRVTIDGTLGKNDSALEVGFSTQDLLPWNDFINYIRGPEAEPRRIAGRAEWRGRVLGPLAGPSFAGHAHAWQARYDRIYWDEIDGEMDYSPDEFVFQHATARRGRSTAAIDLQLHFDGDWTFEADDKWNLTVRLNQSPLDDVQGLFGTNFPVHAVLTGDFQGEGTRGAPVINGTFVLTAIDAWGFAFDRLSARLAVNHDQIQLTNAELSEDSGRVSGSFLYRWPEGQVEFALTGADLPLERFERIQTAGLPIGGRLSFQIRGQGPALRPVVHGTAHLAGLHVGSEVQGDFTSQFDSDGRRLSVALSSSVTEGTLQGQLELGLADGYPLSGELTVNQMDLDPLIQAGLHLKALTGHSSVDGRFTFSGEVTRPETIRVNADVTHVALDYEFVKLENSGPLRFSYRRNELQIEQAVLRGTDTNFRISGSARFSGDRSLNLTMTGSVNLRLASGLFPDLEGRGAAQVDARVQGTYSSPKITGRVRVSDAAAHYGDFPAGLSHVNGEFVFDLTRLVFDDVTAESGGGTLTLSGSIVYGEGSPRYQVTATSSRIRIRYPEGLSWLGAATLQFSGTTRGASLSGSVVVDRLLMSEGVDLATLITASQGPARGEVSSTYLRNLQFDIAVDTSPNARLEWSGAHVETEGSLRLRGTWQHPILLGSIHLFSGEMSFRGNKYQISRGEINFSNPFRLDPVLSVEATTRIQQYDITLAFTGPTSHLTLAYRSDPPLPSSDIIALLALGSTGPDTALRSSTSSQTQGFGATALLSEAISSQLGGPIQRLFGISRFRVDPFLAGTATDQNAAARVTIEQQVSHDLTITYSTNATSNQQQVIQVEYSIRKDISIVALRDLNGTFSLDVKFTRHFK